MEKEEVLDERSILIDGFFFFFFKELRLICCIGRGVKEIKSPFEVVLERFHKTTKLRLEVLSGGMRREKNDPDTTALLCAQEIQ